MAYWKKIKNSDAVPVLKDELVFDETPTVNSTNPVTSDGVARAIAGASGEVPVVTEGDNGKILTAIYDEGGPAVEWADAPETPDELPEYSAADNGKVLGVVTTGVEATPELDWVEVQGGGDTNIIAGDGLTAATASSGDNEYTGTLTNGASSFSANIGVGAFGALKNQSSIPLEFEFPDTMYFSAISANAGQPVYIRAQHNGVTITSPAIGVLVQVLGNAILYWSDVSDTSFDLSTWTNYSSSFLDGNSGYITISFAIPAGGSSYMNVSARYDAYDIPYTLTLTLDESATVLSVTNPVPAYAYANRSQVVRVNQYGEALELGGYAVPDGSLSTAGNILMLDDPSSNSFVWANKVNVYPSLYNNAGKVLTVNSGATGVEWSTPSGGSGGVVLLDYTETDKNLFNAAVAGIANGQPVFVTRSPDTAFTFPAIPLVQRIVATNGNVTETELCFTCISVRNAGSASIEARVEGFALKKTATYNPDTGTTSNSFSRTAISRALQFSA